ncbi:MAG: right-handed parallel beta-helix repeat-containing protein, partial [Promethearchaeota archaeon]
FNNISYNILDNDLWFGIYDSFGSHNTIFRNLITNTIDTGILLTNSNNFSIIENIVENNQNTGIEIEKSNNMTVTDNSVSKNGGVGLTFRGTTITQFHKILRNNITYNDWGLSVAFTQYSLISSNNISHNTNNGLRFEAWNNSIAKNNITNNDQGLFINYGDNNNITQNDISNNQGYGINADGGHLNLIYNNSFYGNAPNGHNDITTNYWDNGIIGNYWDDYVGLDANDDGIGDIPHTKGKIDDNFPFYWDSPVIDIVPTIPVASGSVAPSVSIVISEGVAHSMWYTIEGGDIKYYLYDLVANINQTEWDKFGNENVTIQFYVNDSRGFEGFTELIILKETIAPTSIINYTAYRLPNIINATSIFTITASDLGGSGIQLIRYKINDSSWIIYNTPFDLSGYTSGFYLITYQAIDNAGNIEMEKTELVELIRIPSEPFTIPAYNLVIMISVISVISMLIIRKSFQR